MTRVRCDLPCAFRGRWSRTRVQMAGRWQHGVAHCVKLWAPGPRLQRMKFEGTQQLLLPRTGAAGAWGVLCRSIHKRALMASAAFARGAVNQSHLHEVGLVNFFDGVFFLGEGGGECAEAYRSHRRIYPRRASIRLRSTSSRPLFVDGRAWPGLPGPRRGSDAAPAARTSAKSRERRRRRLAMRGVPRLRRAISSAPPSSIRIFRNFLAERWMMISRSSGSVEIEAMDDAEAGAERRCD